MSSLLSTAVILPSSPPLLPLSLLSLLRSWSESTCHPSGVRYDNGDAGR
jgi:hypothetical protein